MRTLGKFCLVFILIAFSTNCWSTADELNLYFEKNPHLWEKREIIFWAYNRIRENSILPLDEEKFFNAALEELKRGSSDEDILDAVSRTVRYGFTQLVEDKEIEAEGFSGTQNPNKPEKIVTAKGKRKKRLNLVTNSVLRSFDKNDTVEFLSRAGVTDEWLILDLRNNLGGSTTNLALIAGVFLGPEEVIFQEKDGKGEISKLTTRKLAQRTIFSDNIIILVNGRTASSSEILILALRESYDGQVIILGERTVGKGMVCSGFQLLVGNRKLNLYVPSSFWFSKENRSVQDVGIVPDEVVRPDPMAEDYQKQRALEIVGNAGD